MLFLINALFDLSDKGNTLRFPISEFTAMNMIFDQKIEINHVCVPFSVHYHPSGEQTPHPSKTKKRSPSVLSQVKLSKLCRNLLGTVLGRRLMTPFFFSSQLVAVVHFLLLANRRENRTDEEENEPEFTEKRNSGETFGLELGGLRRKMAKQADRGVPLSTVRSLIFLGVA